MLYELHPGCETNSDLWFGKLMTTTFFKKFAFRIENIQTKADTKI